MKATATAHGEEEEMVDDIMALTPTGHRPTPFEKERPLVAPGREAANTPTFEPVLLERPKLYHKRTE